MKRRTKIPQRKSISEILDRYITLDFEKATPSAHSVCSVGLAVVEHGKITHRFYTLIKPLTNEMNPYAQEAHGLETDWMEFAPEMIDVMFKIDKIIGNSPIVGHHVGIERACIEYINEEYGMMFDYDYIDTLRLSKEMGYKKKCNLEVVTEGIGYEFPHHHDPLEDALACRSILEEAVSRRVKVNYWKENPYKE